MSDFMTVTQRAGHIDEVLTEADTRDTALALLRELLRELDEEEHGEEMVEDLFILDSATGALEEIIC